MPTKLLKEFAYELSRPISEIINTSLTQGAAPIQRREANVVPIPKQTPPSIDKLRPVSLTSCIAEVAEGKIAKIITDTIQPNIDKRQYGNRRGMSATHCLIDVYHHLASGAEKSTNISTLALTDFSKAFDVIDHRIAFDSLLKMGVSPAIISGWLTSFLIGNKESSTNYVILTGHTFQAQGTELAPIIFLATINSAQEESKILESRFGSMLMI